MIIGIGGVSTSGKTTLAAIIRHHFSSKRTSILCQDDFVKPIELIPTINGRADWEHPASIDHGRLKATILAEKLENDIVIVEGLMVFWYPDILYLFDKKIFLEIEQSLFKHRKSGDKRWGFEPEWYIDHIWESYLKYGIPEKKEYYYIVDGTKQFKIRPIISYLKS